MIHPIVAAALLVAQAAPTERPCITRAEIADVTVVILPFIIDGARERCRPHVAPTAFLARPSSAEFADRMRAERGGRLASAARGLQKFGDEPPPPGLRDETVVQMMGEAMSGMLLQSADGAKCLALDDLLDSLAPLAPDGIGRLSGAFFALSGADQGGGDRPPICRP